MKDMTYKEFIAAVAVGMGNDYNVNEVVAVGAEGRATTAWAVSVEDPATNLTIDMACFPPVGQSAVDEFCETAKRRFEGAVNGHDARR